ncbi:MAG: thioredoxin domain-containing protein [bacterium]|nr:thioredoxin domain-containing protein [bacterium]
MFRKRRLSVITITVVSLLLSGGLAFNHLAQCNQAVAANCDTASAPATNAEIIELAPGYTVFSEAALVAAHTKGKVVLYFWAPWCTTCTSLDAELQQDSNQIPEGLTVLRVPYDESTALKNRYQVITQHTFVQIDEHGNQLSFWVGGDLENFAKYLK